MSFIRKFLTMIVLALAMVATGSAYAQNAKQPSGHPCFRMAPKSFQRRRGASLASAHPPLPLP